MMNNDLLNSLMARQNPGSQTGPAQPMVSQNSNQAPPSLANGLWAMPSPSGPPPGGQDGPPPPQGGNMAQGPSQAPPTPPQGPPAGIGGSPLTAGMPPNPNPNPAIMGAGGPTVPPAKHAHLPPAQQRWANGQQIQGAVANGGQPNPTLLRVMLGQKS